MNELKDVDYFDNKENIIVTICERQNYLKDLLKQYKDIKNKYIEYDSFYRLELFEFYKIEYNNIIFDFFNKKKFSIGIYIQILL